MEKIHLYAAIDDKMSIAIIKTIMSKSRYNIEWCDIKVHVKNKENQLSPLKLLNAKYIRILDSYFYRMWSNRCKSLALNSFKITPTWCNFVVKNCDCSNVISLNFGQYIEFDEQSINQVILKQLILKFTNLQQLILGFDLKVLLFLYVLKDIFLNCNVKVELILLFISAGEYNYVKDKIIDKFDKDLRISKLHFLVKEKFKKRNNGEIQRIYTIG